MPVPDELTLREARWLALAAQGLATPRPVPARRPGPRQLDAVMARVGTIQLDAVNAVARPQFLVPFSRVGGYDPDVLLGMAGPGRPWMEYWGHAASLLPVALHPLLRWRMDQRADATPWGAAARARWRAWQEEHADYIGAVLAEITERGPLAASQLSDPRRRTGEWWERRSTGRLALEWLFGTGRLAAWRTRSFERVYDLAERVIPPEVLARPTPAADDAQRQLLELAARCLGVATASDLADYFSLPRPVAALRAQELVEDGRLVPVRVEGWRRPALAVPGLRPRPPRRDHATLLSPFDSLIWTRERTHRLFDFHYRIEIYVPEERRTHGYYVLPLLLADELVARFDLRADRKAGVLRVGGSWREPHADPATVAGPAAAELGALATWLGLSGVSVAARGNLARELRRAVA